jgi:hypothetical protein
MQTLKRLLAHCVPFTLPLVAAGCIVAGVGNLHLDDSASMQSPTAEADRLGVSLTTRSTGRFGGSPYAFWVEIWYERGSRGAPAAIEISEAVLEIRYSDLALRELALSTKAEDWNPELAGETIRFALFRPKTPLLDVDFVRLKEIRFRLKFAALYANGERREYWIERYLRPKVLIRGPVRIRWSDIFPIV